MRERKYSATVQKRGGKWVARLQYYSPEGKRMSVIKTADYKGEADEELQKLIKKHKAGVVHSRHKTFSELAEELKKSKYGPAEYSPQGKKISGVRDPRKVASTIARLTEAFGEKRLTSISIRDLEEYKTDRLKTVKIVSVNRELALLRAMLNHAVRRRYLDVSPFSFGEKLIDIGAEDSRFVTISDAEEEALLAQCEGESRRHLKALIIAAVESGCRLGELLRLRWSDVNFANNTFWATSYKGANMTRREVPLTARTRAALLSLRKKPSINSFRKEDMDETLVFGIADNVRKSFNAARHAAGLDHLHFHDLRHTAATRLANAKMNAALIGQILGHKNPKTTARYINMTDEALDTARSILEGRKNA